MSIAENVEAVCAEIKKAEQAANRQEGEVLLIGVSKTVEPERMKEALKAGIHVFGENYVQELCAKYEEMHEAGAVFHFIGHLQTNKVKYIIDKVEMIQSVDSIKLLREIEKQAKKIDKVMDILVEINVGGEESKTGLSAEDLPQMLEEIRKLQHVRLCGLMTIPPICDEKTLNTYFEAIRELYIDIQRKKLDNSNICMLSMGMSGDFPLAIAKGATAVRVGTAIFGTRQYVR